MNKDKTNQLIKRAIDSYPGGICFASLDGRVILSNKKMNDLLLQLIGHTMLNAEATWNELSCISVITSPTRLEKPWLLKSASNLKSSCKHLFFELSDHSIWQFEYKPLDKATIQIEATDITRLYRLSDELYENSIKLQKIQERQQSLLKNIVQVNENKEILSAKMKIHDEFGQVLLATNKAIVQHTFPENSRLLIENWNNCIQNFLNVSPTNFNKNKTVRNELLEVAELIGCKIIFLGNLPTNIDALHLLYASIREALTNAVRHANATELFVKLQDKNNYYYAEIFDNGDTVHSKIAEGTGLTTLRKRLEQNGASLSIRCDKHVTLCVRIPYQKKGEKQ